MPHRETSRTAFFPFLVRLASDKARAEDAIFSVGHRLGVVLLETRAGAGRVLRRDALEALDVDPCAAYLRARTRLDRLHASELLPYAVFDAPLGGRCLVFHHPMLAASCLLLPSLFELAVRELGCDRICASVPRRDRLIVMADRDRSERRALREFAIDVVGRSNIELSTELFMVDAAGPSPVITPGSRLSQTETALEIEILSDDAA